MGIEVPGAVRWVSDKVLGTDWPDADETAMKRVANAWSTTARTIEAVSADADSGVMLALRGIEGDVNTAIDEMWTRLGPEGAMTELIAYCDALAEMVEGAADDVEEAKLAIIAALGVLAAELVAIAAATVVTLGVASPAALAAQAATQVTIRMVIRQLILSILRRVAVGALREGGKAFAEEFALEGAVQIYEIVKGDRNGVDFGAMTKAGASGLAGGLVTGGLNGGFRVPKNSALAGEVTDFIGGQVSDVALGGTRASDFIKEEALSYTTTDEQFESATGISVSGEGEPSESEK